MQQIAARKAELDRLRARAPGGLSNFEHMQDLELTYTSLTAVETTLVVKKGITIGGKPLKDHLEAVDHFEALHYVRELARQTDPRTNWTRATYIGWWCCVPPRRLPGAMPIRAGSC
jgi:hypothetical protein